MRIRHALVPALLALALVLTATACTRALNRQEVEDHLYGNFETVVARAPQDGYTAYWLGRGFTAGGLEFKGPTTADFAQEVEGGGSWANYSPKVDVGDQGAVLVSVISYSPVAWAKARPPTGTSRSVELAGKTATMTTSSTSSRPVLHRSLILQLGETTIVASAASGGSTTPGGPDVNPLIDEATFLSVMQQLRPYAQ